MLNKLQAATADDFTDIGISHPRKHEKSVIGGDNPRVLWTAGANGPYLVRDGGVKDGKVTGNTTFNELFKNDVGRSDTHLWAPRACVINLHRDTRSADHRASQLDTGERVPRHIDDDLLFRHYDWLIEGLKDRFCCAP